MKHFLLALLVLSGSITGLRAADGYTVKLKFTDYANKKIALAHYYGKPLPTIYKVDSALVDKNGVAVLESKSKIIGGIYLVVLEGNTSYFEFLLDNGKNVDMTVTTAKLPLGVTFKNNAENEKFFKYMSFLNDVGEKHKGLSAQMATAKTKADTTAIQKKIAALGTDVTTFRTDYVKQNPGTMLSNIFNALEMPNVPTRKNADGTPDEESWYREYKARYWDNVVFTDERLTYTPLMDNRMHTYFDRFVLSTPDSFIADADRVIAKARPSKEMFKYTVQWLTNYVQESDVMGMDAVFVHMVENYYLRGDAFWVTNDLLQKYAERARSIAPNVIGNMAPELKMTKLDGTDQTLSDVKAKYTLLVFWSPDCGHCLEVIPRIDSSIKAQGLEKKGLKVIAFNVDKENEEKWKKIISEKKLDSWMHVHDPARKSDFRAQYDVYGTPSIYLLDERKIIRGKKLDQNNIGQVIEMLEEQALSKNKL